MHDIWNPWHGCKKISEGCQHCYMYCLDRMRDQDGSRIYKTARILYYFSRNTKGRVISKDISTLDVSDSNGIISSWGGLSEFSSRASEVVAKYLVDDES